MTLEERVGQLVMVPLLAGSDPSSLASTIADEHIGSAILIGNWNTGVDTVKTATAQLQGYAPAGNRLIIATDQEGGQVQHLTGTGFDTMPVPLSRAQCPLTHCVNRQARGVRN